MPSHLVFGLHDVEHLSHHTLEELLLAEYVGKLVKRGEEGWKGWRWGGGGARGVEEEMEGGGGDRKGGGREEEERGGGGEEEEMEGEGVARGEEEGGVEEGGVEEGKRGGWGEGVGGGEEKGWSCRGRRNIGRGM